jgi:hypothetical protein
MPLLPRKICEVVEKNLQFFSLNSKVPHSFPHSFQSGAENRSVFEESDRTGEGYGNQNCVVLQTH